MSGYFPYVARTVLLLGILALISSGCNPANSAPKLAAAAPPEVSVANPVSEKVTDHLDFTGQSEAAESVDIKARVSGYLTKTLFKPGSEVKAGDVLFEIDPRPYQADLERLQGDLAGLEARLKRQVAEMTRAERLFKNKTLTAEDYEKTVGDHGETVGQIAATKASIDKAGLDLSFATIKAPFAGRVSRDLISVGNLVSANITLLTTLVSIDPIFVYFDMDEQNLLYLRELVRDKKIKSLDEARPPILLGLANETGHPHKGVIDFADNRVNPGLGTIKVRGTFENPDRSLVPGLFARIRIPIGEPHDALMVADRAIGTDQGQKYVLIVNDQNEVGYRIVKLGRLDKGMRVIEQGITAHDRVIVNGLQRARPGTKVTPQTVEMRDVVAPKSTPAANAKAPSSSPPKPAPAKAGH